MRVFAVLCTLLFAVASAHASISPRIYNALNEIQQKISSQPTAEDLIEIKSDLSELKQALKNNPLGLALTLQTFSQLSDFEGDYTQSQKFLLQAVSIPNLQLNTLQQLRAALAFSYFREEQYKKSAELMNVYIKENEKESSAGIYALLAASYYGLEAFQLGLPHIEKAISISKKPKEHWLQMAFSGQYQNKAYEKALTYVNQLVFYYPDKKDYWNQKAGLHQMLENYSKAAIARALAYEKNLLNKESEFINLGQLLVSQGDPYSVGKALSSAIETKILEPSEKLLRLEYQAWLQAKEMTRALDVLDVIYNEYKELDDAITLMQFYMDQENWSAVNGLASKVLKQEMSLPKKGKVHLLNGISLHKLGMNRKATLQLSQAVSIEETAGQAKGWMNYIKQKTN